MTDLALIEAELLRLVAECGPAATVNPALAAQNLAGHAGDQWGPLMHPLRRVAVRLAREGRLALYRKGKPVDPDEVRGVYRIGAVRQD